MLHLQQYVHGVLGLTGVAGFGGAAQFTQMLPVFIWMLQVQHLWHGVAGTGSGQCMRQCRQPCWHPGHPGEPKCCLLQTGVGCLGSGFGEHACNLVQTAG